MKRGAHLLAPGLAGVEGWFVKEFMLVMDGISVGGHKKERGFSPVMSVTGFQVFANSSTESGSIRAVCLSTRFVARSLPIETASTDTKACLWQATLSDPKWKLIS